LAALLKWQTIQKTYQRVFSEVYWVHANSTSIDGHEITAKINKQGVTIT
jgi:hypothetical protein